MKAKAVFLDRDGVINEERGYVHTQGEFAILPKVPKALKILKASGFKLVIVSNQSGIARGLFSEVEVEMLHSYLSQLLSLEGVSLDGIYYCPHHVEGTVEGFSIQCNCRKPMPGLLYQAATDLDLEISNSYLVGDKLSDVQAGRNAGVRANFLVRTGHELSEEAIKKSNYVVNDLFEAAARILAISD